MSTTAWWRSSMLALLCVLGLFCPPSNAGVLRTLDFQTPTLRRADGHPRQWDNYVPEPNRQRRFTTSGISLGAPGALPYPLVQAARFKPQLSFGRPRSMANVGRDTPADPGVDLNEPVDAAQGLERYYQWFTYFPRSFSIPKEAGAAITIFQAWHGDSRARVCNPTVTLGAQRLDPRATRIHLTLTITGGRFTYGNASWPADKVGADGCRMETFKFIDLGPLPRGRWIRWRMHALWNTDPAKGLTEVWRGARRFAVRGANLYRLPSGPDHGYMEEGIYAPQEPTAAARRRFLWQAGMTIATSMRDLEAPRTCRRLRLVGAREAGGAPAAVLSRRSTWRRAPRLRLTTPRRPSVRIDGRGVWYRSNRSGRTVLPARAFDRPGVHRLAVRGAVDRRTLRVRSVRCR